LQFVTTAAALPPSSALCCVPRPIRGGAVAGAVNRCLGHSASPGAQEITMRKPFLALALLVGLGGCAVYPDGSLGPAPVYVQPAVVAPAPVFVSRPWGWGGGYYRPYGYGWGRPGWGPGWRRW
jgi:hypothetical protein